MNAPTAEKLAYTLAEVAEMTGLSLRSLQEGTRRGTIPHSRHGRQKVMTRDQIARFLAASEVAADSGEPSGDVARIEETRRRVSRRYQWGAAA